MGKNELDDTNELIKAYPFFNIARWLRLKILQNSDSAYFEEESKITSVYANDRRNLFYFIFPETKLSEETEFLRDESSGSYFDIIESTEKNVNVENKKSSLSELAKKMMSARDSMQQESDKQNQASEDSEAKQTKSERFIEKADWESMESYSKQLIKEKKFKEALAILEDLNLNNPKKSVYFADQIRFLKKIIEN